MNFDFYKNFLFFILYVIQIEKNRMAFSFPFPIPTLKRLSTRRSTNPMNWDLFPKSSQQC